MHQFTRRAETTEVNDFRDQRDRRQRINPTELLNRWIIPLENRVDYLSLSNGRKIQVPFEQLIIFSTNLEPHDLADDAFLRRIPFKVEIGNPSGHEFHLLFQIAGSHVLGCLGQGAQWAGKGAR